MNERFNPVKEEVYQDVGAGSKSNWSNSPVSSESSSSFYDYGSLDEFDHQLEVNYLSSLVRPQMKCLDLGCGKGRFSEFLLERGCEVEAVDLEPMHINFMKGKFHDRPLSLHLGDAFEYVAANPGPYDLIVVSGLLIFLDDARIENFLSLMQSRLSSGGVIFIRDFVSNHDSIRISSSQLAGAHIYYRPIDFYKRFQVRHVQTARPYHRFPKIEGIIARIMGKQVYCFLFRSERIRALTWKGAISRNVLFSLSKS